MGDHSRGGAPHGSSFRRLAWTLALVLAYMGAEVVGGILANSLALLADAGHMLADAGALGLALFTVWIARRPGPPERTFGYRRAEILAALAHGAALVAIALLILIEAWERLSDPPAVDGALMMAVAAGGLLVNIAGLRILHRSRQDSLNLRGAWLHVLGDTLGSVQAIAAGALIWLAGWTWLDPVASVLIAALIVWSSWSLLRDAVNVLLEAAPGRIDVAELRAAIAGVEGVADVHDLHVWTIATGFESLSVHARVAGREADAVLAEIQAVLHERFHIPHCTVQVETARDCPAGDCR